MMFRPRSLACAGLFALCSLLVLGCSSSEDFVDPDSGGDGGVDGTPADGTPGDTGGGTDKGTKPPAKVVTCNNTLPPAAQGTCSGTAGSGAGVLISAGAVLGPDTVYENGQLLYVEQRIVCVGCECASDPQAKDATRIDCARGVLSPGLINLHDHLGWTENAPPEPTTVRYDHRHEWRKGLNGKPKIPQPWNKTQKDNMGPLWGELRQVLAGTTSIAGAAGGNGLLRNLDSSKTEGLAGKIEAPTFPLGDSGGQLLVNTCEYEKQPDVSMVKSAQSYLAHVAEGNNEEAHNEYLCLSGQGPGSVDVTTDNAAFIHAMALNANDMYEMAGSGTGINWSPRSNISLYGMTAHVAMAKTVGIQISLGTDWTLSGSINLLRELACASYLNEKHFAGTFSAEELWRMVTANAADQSGFSDRLGRLKGGLVPDLAVYDGTEHKYHEAVTRGEASRVALVIRGGKVLYGDAAAVQALGGTTCDAIDVCGADRRVCLKSEIDHTFDEFKKRFVYKDVPYQPYDLFFCSTPTNEPSCVPSRPGEYDGPKPGDSDGDGVEDTADSCPKIFNPPRPMGGNKQPDSDSDGVGDECDPCPLDKDTTTCSQSFNTDDRDGDGVPNDSDNCPGQPNKDQKDTDDDKLGDACDPCPQAKGTCPFTIPELRDPKLGKKPAGGTVVRISGVVTGVRMTKSLGFYLRQGKGPYEAIFVFTSVAPTTTDTSAPLKVGDKVDVEAKYKSFHDVDELTDATLLVVTGTGDATPLDVKASELQPGSARAEELESQLVRIKGATVKAMVKAGDDDFWATDDGNACSGATPPCAQVTDFMYDGSVNDGKPAASVGQSFSAIVGQLDGFDNVHVLSPRDDADLQQ